jgi:SagB-type dehydrogenase family enzyme
MTSGAVVWTFSFAPNVEVEVGARGAFLRTAGNQTRVETSAELEVVKLLAAGGRSEAEIQNQIGVGKAGDGVDTQWAALLFRLDRLGFLTRGLTSRGRCIVSCVPLRPPPGGPPERAPEGGLRLSPAAIGRAEGEGISIEVPGAWAKMIVHDRALLPLLHDLTVARTAIEMRDRICGYGEAIPAVLALMSWCELLDCTSRSAWSDHDLLFHTRTRAGYTRGLVGKIPREKQTVDPTEPRPITDGTRRTVLKPPDLDRLLAEDPPYALISERRQSIRRQAAVPIASDELSEFLFRTFHQRQGRRPYPSGGSCYPLTSYLAVGRCRGLMPGLYAYDPRRHELATIREPGPGLDRLLDEAAGAADVGRPPQILLVLAAQYFRMRRAYPDLSYSLILKEVGAIFQVAMMAAAVMGLAVCPLGCGNSLLFSQLAGTNPLSEPSVGELMLGSREGTG